MRVLGRFVSYQEGTVPPWAVVVKEVETDWTRGIGTTTLTIATVLDPATLERVWWLIGTMGRGEPVVITVATEQVEVVDALKLALNQCSEVVQALACASGSSINTGETVYTHPEEVPLP